MSPFAELLNVIYQAVVLIGIIGGAIFAFVKWVTKQNQQDSDIAETKQSLKNDLDDLEHKHDTDAQAIKEEQAILVYGVLACLKGLQEQGCNGPVTKAIDKLEKHLNLTAHK